MKCQDCGSETFETGNDLNLIRTFKIRDGKIEWDSGHKLFLVSNLSEIFIHCHECGWAYEIDDDDIKNSLLSVPTIKKILRG